MSKPSFIKFRIIAGIVGGLVCAGVIWLANKFLDTSFSNELIIILSLVVAVVFAVTLKPKNNSND